MILDHMPRGSAFEAKMEIVDTTAEKWGDKRKCKCKSKQRETEVGACVGSSVKKSKSDKLLVRLPFMSSQVKMALKKMK